MEQNQNDEKFGEKQEELLKELLQEEKFRGLITYLVENKRRLSKDFWKQLVQSMPNLLELSNKYLDSISSLVESKEKVSVKFLDTLQETREGLQTYLSNNINDLSSEERIEILKSIMKITEMAQKADRDHKQFLLKIAGVIGTFATIVAVAVVKVFAERQNRTSSGELQDYENEDDENEDYDGNDEGYNNKRNFS